MLHIKEIHCVEMENVSFYLHKSDPVHKITFLFAQYLFKLLLHLSSIIPASSCNGSCHLHPVHLAFTDSFLVRILFCLHLALVTIFICFMQQRFLAVLVIPHFSFSPSLKITIDRCLEAHVKYFFSIFFETMLMRSLFKVMLKAPLFVLR